MWLEFRRVLFRSLTTPLPLKDHVGPAAAPVPADGALRDLRSLDARARYAKTVGEVAQRSGNGAPAAAYRAAAYACLTSVRGLLVNHEIKRHDLGQKVSKKLQRFPVAVRQLRRQRELQLAIDRGRPQSDVLDRLNEHPPLLGPPFDVVFAK